MPKLILVVLIVSSALIGACTASRVLVKNCHPVSKGYADCEKIQDLD